MLKAMPPSSIEKIETISNPSAKYEAEGTAGIINIKMAKHETLGWSGEANLWTAYDKKWKHNEGLNLNYVNDRWTFNTSLSYNRWAGQTDMENTTFIYTNPTTRMKMDKVSNAFDFRGLNGSFSTDFKINDKSSIGAMFSINADSRPEIDNPLTRTRIATFPYAVVDSSYSNHGLEYGHGRNIAANLWYSHKIDSLGGQYSITLDYDNNSSKDFCFDEANYYHGDFATLIDSGSDRDSTKNKYNTYSLKFDLIKKYHLNLEQKHD